MPEKHGRDKEAEADDPNELVGTAAPGQPETMARCIIEEYARLGWGRDRLKQLFESEFYRSAHRLYRHLGEETIERLIEQSLRIYGPVEYEVESTSSKPGPSQEEDSDVEGS